MSFSDISAFPTVHWTQQFHRHSWQGPVLITVAITIVFFLKSYTSRILAAWPFYTHRYDFIQSNLEKTRHLNAVTFDVLHHNVTVIKGPNGRKAFFDDKNLSFIEGQKLLVGIVPSLLNQQLRSENGKIPSFIKHLTLLIRKDRLSSIIPTVFGDIQDRMDTWGKQGVMDPSKNVYDLVFKMTVSMLCCRDLATDLPTVAEMQRHYRFILEKSATPISAMFPWFPAPAKLAQLASGKALFTILSNYIEERTKAPVSTSDAVGILQAQGLNNADITAFSMTAFLTGIANTSVHAYWVLLFISFHSQWKSAIYAEIYALLAHYADPSDPLHKQLSCIPITAWEDEMPTTELVLRETVRLASNVPLFRRNPLGSNSWTLPGGIGAVPSGSYIAYSASDVHMNPNVFTDPETFDPQRFSPERGEDKREPYSFIGWGAGRHHCPGMKFAKLEIRMVMAMFVMGYEYELVDSKGRIPERLPLLDHNNRGSPKGEPCFIKFKRVVE